MKRIIIYAWALLAVTSVACTNVYEDVFVEEEEEQEKIYISASTEFHIAETRTYLGDLSGNSYPVKWSTDDQIALISDEGNSVFTLVPETGNETHATFGGNAGRMPAQFPNTLVYPAAYPVEGAFADGGGVVLKVGSAVPTIQTLVNNLEGDTRCFENNTFPMAAASTEPTSFQFYNMAGIVRLKIFYTPDSEVLNDAARILRITLKGNNREILSGPVAMQFSAEDASPITSTATKDNGKAVGVYGTTGKEKVIIDLSCETGATSGLTGLDLPTSSDSPLQVDLVVIPQTFTDGFTVEIMDASTMGTQIYKVNHEVTVERSKILEMTAIDYVKPAPLEVANCYIVSEPGEYMMPAFAFGNRIGTNFKDGYPGFDPDQTNVDILWTDIVEGGNKIDAITDLEYMKFSDGSNYISYRLNTDSNGEPYRGNVVLALYDEWTKEIYWTWHLWLCDQPQDVIIDGKCAKGSYSGEYPDGTGYIYQAYATYSDMRILDRNLGAIHAYPSECDVVGGVTQVWQTYGLYYQDGRRDPFIGGDYNGGWAVQDEMSYSKDNIIKYLHRYETTPFSTGTHDTWTNIALFGDDRGWKFDSKNKTITQTLNCPQMYSFSTGNMQWTDYLSGDNLSWMDSVKYPDYAKHGKTGLLYGDHEAYWNRTKTIFDPCPPGYSVLGERGGYFIGGAGTKTWCGDDTNGYGLMYTYGSNDIWWPAAGVRSLDGCMAGVGKFGFYFFYDHIDKDHGGHGFGFQLANYSSGSASTSMSPKFFNDASAKDQVLTNHATPIRCVKAIQEAGGPDLDDPKPRK